MCVCVCVCVCVRVLWPFKQFLSDIMLCYTTSKLLNDIPLKWGMVNGLQFYNFSVWLVSHSLTQSIAFNYVNVIRLTKAINSDTANQPFNFFIVKMKTNLGRSHLSKKDYICYDDGWLLTNMSQSLAGRCSKSFREHFNHTSDLDEPDLSILVFSFKCQLSSVVLGCEHRSLSL